MSCASFVCLSCLRSSIIVKGKVEEKVCYVMSYRQTARPSKLKCVLGRSQLEDNQERAPLILFVFLSQRTAFLRDIKLLRSSSVCAQLASFINCQNCEESVVDRPIKYLCVNQRSNFRGNKDWFIVSSHWPSVNVSGKVRE